MWIFSTKGFCSIVEHWDDPGQVVIRARLQKDIQNFKGIFESLRLKTSKVSVNSRSDYKYRFIADRMDWIAVMTRLMLDLHYTNFKDAVYRAESGDLRDKREEAYLRVWAVMRKLQLSAE